MEAEPGPHRVPEVGGPATGLAQQRRHRRPGPAATSADPPWPGRSTSTTWWSAARSASIEPHTRPVWVKPWAITRRRSLPRGLGVERRHRGTGLVDGSGFGGHGELR